MVETVDLHPLCTESFINSSIYEVVLLKASKATVDRWVVIMENICEEHEGQDCLPKFLLDLRAETQPIAFMMRRMEDLIKQYPFLLECHIAFLHNEGFPLSLVQTQLKNMGAKPKTLIGFFVQTDRNNAIDWLMETESC